MTETTTPRYKQFRQSLYLWLNLIASLIYEWNDDYEYSREHFSERFFEALEPMWGYPSLDDDIPF
jgi:hypothetical protein